MSDNILKKEDKIMTINWFPGHMKKTLDEMRENIKLCDAVIYVLDARIPLSSLNPQISEIAKNKPILYVLNKADLADEKTTKKFVERFILDGKFTISVVSSAARAKADIIVALEKILASKIEKNHQKQVANLLKIMVIGVPNTGKSSIINAMCGKAKMTTGNKAGVTKHTQWAKVDGNFALLDTPGTLWPKLEDQKIAEYLAFVGSIKDDVLNIEELGFELFKLLISRHGELVASRYGKIEQCAEEIDMYNILCKKRGFIMRGGEIDYLRAGRAILDDFRSGKIARITLDELENGKR